MLEIYVILINTDGYCCKTARDNISLYVVPDVIGHWIPFLQASPWGIGKGTGTKILN